MALTEKTKKVYEYLKDNQDKNLTAADVADELELTKKSVDGIFTRGLQCKGYGFREEVEVTNSDGSHQKVKYLRLNEAGLALDPDAKD